MFDNISSEQSGYKFEEGFKKFDPKSPINLSPLGEPSSEDQKLNELKSKLKSG
jgi:hypothetical protein